jgi:hypothetical protein
MPLFFGIVAQSLGKDVSEGVVGHVRERVMVDC